MAGGRVDAGYWSRRWMMVVLVLLVVLSLGAVKKDGVVLAAKLPHCNKFQLLTCIGSAGGPPTADCCKAIRRVLNPRCVCTPSVQTNVHVLLPIAKTCKIKLHVSKCH